MRVTGTTAGKPAKRRYVLIIGSGISGILHAQLAKFKGVENIIVADINPYRLELAKKFGAQPRLKRQRQPSRKTQRNKRWTLS